MEKKTIGQFIAVLRKANGLTQQELADKLNVSNKAVSRWEREESAPDITLIPALAELLGVTCDELLKEGRITYSEQVDKRDAKVEKQVKSLIQRVISKYRIIMWIALALVVVGFIMPFVLAPSPDVPEVLCWVILILSQIVAFVMVTIAVAQMRDIRLDSEMFENADAALVKNMTSI
ncbi:MAG: helix-turn-helix domain-containing protein [Agathobacter sp.]|nr:helix-turn-helix domain-containing protein [Agathobacter sp.]